MPVTSTTRRQPGGLKARVLGLALTVLILFGSASAQQLTNLLPQETFAAFGFSGLAQHEAKFQPFVSEWQRLGLTDLLSAAFAEEEVDDLEDAYPAEFEGLDFYDFFGDEAWFTVSASRTSPLPTFTGVARVSSAAAAALEQVLERETEGVEVQVLTEGSIEFRVGASDEFSDPVAYAIDGDFVVVSTNPDVLRGVLRRYQGATEPSFLDSPGYAASLAPLMPSNVVLYFDLPHIVDLAEPFVTGMGFDATVDRLGRALRTFGTYGAVNRFTSEGLEALSLQALGDASLDPELHALLSSNLPVSSGPLAFVGEGAVSYQASGVPIQEWWAYLDRLTSELPELGIGGIDGFVRDNLGLDLGQLLFDWMGTTFAVITPYSAPVEIGVMPENLLGASLYLVETTDPAAAREGLSMLMMMGGMFASSFADPYGEGGGMPPAPEQRTVAGVTVDSYLLTEGVIIETAVHGGYVLVATDPASMDAALTAASSGGGLTGELASLAENVPAGAGSILLQDGEATFRMLGEQLSSQFALFSGLAGSEFDFDAAEASSEALGAYMEFVAGKMGGQYSYGVSSGTVLRTYSLTNVTW